MTMPLWQLAGKAVRRQFPDFFEQAWYARTGVNPVHVAIQVQENILRRTMWASLKFVTVCAFLAVAWVATLQSDFGVTVDSDVMFTKQTFKYVVLFVTSALTFIGMLWLMLFAGAERGERPEIQPSEFESTNEFCEDLYNVFFRWAPEDHSYIGGDWHLVFQDFNHVDGEKKAREYAKALMTRAAEAVVAREMTNAEISTRYDALLRLGLVRPGGYARYIKEAEKAQSTPPKAQAA